MAIKINGTTVIDDSRVGNLASLTASGNITGNYILGNGSQLTGIDATSIQNGTANVRTFLNGNVTTSAAGSANVLVVTSTGANIAGTLNATGNANVGNLGATTVVATNVAGTLTTEAQPNITSVGSLTSLTVTGNITGGNLTVNTDAVITGNLTVNGNTTTINSTTVTTNDLLVNMANNAATSAAANGGGIAVGPAGGAYASWTYDQPNSRWSTALAINATGNISGGNVSGTTGTFTNVAGTLTTAAQTNITSVGTLGSLTVTGNITGGNLLGKHANGTSSVDMPAANGNINLVVAGTTTGVITSTGANVTGTLNVTGNANVGNIGGTAAVFTNLTGTLQTASQTNITAVGTIATGTWQGSSISTTYTDAKVTSVNGSTGAVSGLATTAGTLAQFAATTSSQLAGVISDETGSGSLVFATSPTLTTPNIGAATGTSLNISTGALTCGSIVNANANGVGNIGSTTTYFNTIHAKATSAQYADLAEMYEADQIIEPGTVVCFGGAKEVTVCSEDSSRRVAGVVSTNPSYIMNAGLAGDNVVAVALTGRVPTKVTGTIRKGDMLVAAGDGRARAEADPAVGAVIGKALADFDGAEGTIEVVVGRL